MKLQSIAFSPWELFLISKVYICFISTNRNSNNGGHDDDDGNDDEYDVQLILF